MHMPFISYADLSNTQLRQLTAHAAFDLVMAPAELASRFVEDVRHGFSWGLFGLAVAGQAGPVMCIERFVEVASSRMFGRSGS
jgi:hypothetical protein